MKLLYCTNCCAIFNLTFHEKNCVCAKSRGYCHEDGLTVSVEGPCRVLGIGNESFALARDAPDHPDGKGNQFSAFFIPEPHEHIVRSDA